MTYPLLDTDVIVRFVTGDDPLKQAAAAALFHEVADGKLTLVAPVTVIADAVFVLSSRRLYHLPRAEVAALLTALLRYTGLRVHHRRAVMRALEVYGSNNLDFGDAMIAATMELVRSTTVYSYDAHFDRIPGIQRREP